MSNKQPQNLSEVKKTAVAQKAASEPAIIDVHNLKTQFGNTVIHEHLDMKVSARQIVALVGGSGSGKTTLLKQILGLLHPAAGIIKIQGAPPDAPELQRVAAARIGMLFQQGALFSTFPVIENIAFPLMEHGAVSRDEALACAALKLQMVGLKVKDAWKKPSDLSGGMIKRVALARALIMDPPLLLLDEPTAGLDPQASEEFVQLLSSMHQDMGLTVVMVTHDLDTIFEVATHIAVLAEKRVLILDTPEKVIAYQHQFIDEFFNGARGKRAQAALKDRAARGMIVPAHSAKGD